VVQGNRWDEGFPDSLNQIAQESPNSQQLSWTRRAVSAPSSSLLHSLCRGAQRHDYTLTGDEQIRTLVQGIGKRSGLGVKDANAIEAEEMKASMVC
jgi:hypothetical protein